MIQNHLNNIGDQSNDLCLKYEHFILIGDFNSEMCQDAMKVFCSIYNIKNLVNEPTCFNNVEYASCIDLILTNKPLYFQKTTVIETGISDYHKLTVTIMKSSFQKQEPIIFNYSYKRFNDDKFRNDLLYEFSKKGFRGISCDGFQFLFMTTLNKPASMKIKYIRANNSPFMNNDLSKAITVRSRLRNKFLKLKTNESREAYKTQRNYRVSLLRQVKKNFYENLSPNLITDNKMFWKQDKPFLPNTPSNNKITLSEGSEIISNPSTCAEILNNLYCDTVKDLDIDRSMHIHC